MGKLYRPRRGYSPALIIVLALPVVVMVVLWTWIALDTWKKPFETHEAKSQNRTSADLPRAPTTPAPTASRQTEKASTQSFEASWNAALELIPSARANALKRLAERKKNILTPDEATVIDGLIARCGDSSELTASELLLFVKFKLGDYAGLLQAKWASKDPECKTATRIVWKRSPSVHDPAELLILMQSWGNLSPSQRAQVLPLLRLIEAGEPVSPNERDLVIRFAGEEYYAKRPRE